MSDRSRTLLDRRHGLHRLRARLPRRRQDVVVTYHQHRHEPDFLPEQPLAPATSSSSTSPTSTPRGHQKHQPEGIVYLAVPALAGVSPADEFKTNTQGYLNVSKPRARPRSAGDCEPAGHLLQRQARRGPRTWTSRSTPRIDRGVPRRRSKCSACFSASAPAWTSSSRVAAFRSALPLDGQPAQPPVPRRAANGTARRAPCAAVRRKPATAATIPT